MYFLAVVSVATVCAVISWTCIHFYERLKPEIFGHLDHLLFSVALLATLATVVALAFLPIDFALPGALVFFIGATIAGVSGDHHWKRIHQITTNPSGCA